MNEDDSDPIIKQTVTDENVGRSLTEIETYESKKELRYPKKYDSDQPIVIILDDLNEKEKNDARLQAMFKRSRRNNLSVFIISQDYYELPKKVID